MKAVAVDATGDFLLHSYMRRHQDVVPYFFPVSIEAFSECLRDGQYNGFPVFDEYEVYGIPAPSGEMSGWIQFGRCGFHFGSDGRQFAHPVIGNIRHFYFEGSEPGAGTALLQKAWEYFRSQGIHEIFAFYHAMGMSCYAGHGKLHESIDHVHRALVHDGMKIQHQNAYFVAELQDGSAKSSLEMVTNTQDGRTEFTLCDGHTLLGTASAKDLSGWVEGDESRVVYLLTIEIQEGFQGRGLGKQFLSMIMAYYKNEGMEWLHTDTAVGNAAARRLYESTGFTCKGITTDYHVVRE